MGCSYCGRVNYSIFKVCACGKKRTESELHSDHGTWKCSFCGRSNTLLSRGCVCGKTKRESEQNKIDKANEKKQPQNNDDVLSNLDALKKLKELLDMGAITQDEFDLKKSKLLK